MAFPVVAGFVPLVATGGTKALLLVNHVVLDIARQLGDCPYFGRTACAVAAETHAGQRNLFALGSEVECLCKSNLLQLLEREPATIAVASGRGFGRGGR